MSYIVGNQFRRPEQLITANLSEEFNSARAGGDGIIELPDIKPTRTAGMMRQGGDITRVAPHFYDPRYQHTTLAIPTDERTLHGLYRFFDDHDPLVGNAIRMHTEFPLSDFRLGNCGDPGVQNHYEELWDRIDGDNLLMDITTEFWRIGNVFPFGAWNEEDYMWDQFAIMNPDYVSVQSSWITQKPLITLQPDEYLKRVVNSMQPRMVYEQLPPEIIRYVRLNQEIPMDPNNIFHLSFNKAPYEKLGKSIMKRLLRLLMYEDRLYQAQFAIATRHIVPLTVVKVGDPNLGWVPSSGELEDLREMFAAYELDPNFTLFYHWGINVEFYGATGKILPVNQEFERIQKLKFIGLGINESLITGQGTYANAYASLQVLRQRYLNLQLKLERLVHNGWFKPVAQAAGFYRSDKRFTSGTTYTGPSYGAVREFKQAKEELANSFKSLRDFQDKQQFQGFLRRKALERVTANMESNVEYVYPEMKWGKMSMTQDTSYGNLLAGLKENPLFSHMVSEASVADSLHLDREVEMEQTIQEAIEKEEWAKEYQEETGYPPPGGGAGGPPGVPGGVGEFGGLPDAGGIGGEGPIPGPGPEMGELGGLVAVEPGEVGPASPQGEGAAEGIATFERPIVTGVATEHGNVRRENEELASKK